MSSPMTSTDRYFRSRKNDGAFIISTSCSVWRTCAEAPTGREFKIFRSPIFRHPVRSVGPTVPQIDPNRNFRNFPRPRLQLLCGCQCSIVSIVMLAAVVVLSFAGGQVGIVLSPRKCGHTKEGEHSNDMRTMKPPPMVAHFRRTDTNRPRSEKRARDSVRTCPT